MTQPPPTPPEYPEPSARPDQPGAAQVPPQYPPQYPPSYPQQPAPQPPPGPGPGAAVPPQYPQAPQYPTAPGALPHIPAQASPPYPQAPQYPQNTATPQAPQYPQNAAAPQYPQGAPAPQPPYPQAAPPPAPDSPLHPHHISTDPGRLHVSRHQRQTDATAFGNLLLHLPNFLCSLVVVALVSLVFGGFGILIVLAWLASGALVFHRPTESALARHLLRLRYPTPQERAKLEPVWREVTARAGVEGRNYELWVEDSDSLNAVAAAGHIVGVTRFAMNQLPNGELAAVMAHELGHHVGGHAWSGLLGYWYALPGRIAWRVLRAVTWFMFRVSRVFSCFGVLFFGLVVGGIALATISTLYGLPLLILAMPYALAAVGRRSELRADQHAAALGFAPMLAAVLEKLHQQEQQQAAAIAAVNGGAPATETPVSKLLSSHPDYYTRLHHLQPYLQPSR
ncbi:MULTISPECIES: M48 family metalloprotease [unclassified Streptomyces]|uniref:M48 family metalloprotease n=1 Tax=unclassified Streptomyces TaxID=2593676 RepID=UPI000F6E3DC0|nr:MULTISPECIES: M48 family metalloprotease [unclassified Streptomyces]AZM60593.1 peptidase [Streptomyces sp. WAC 01438]RSM91071.1 peptidase [Streptomyces sp. WAC 01420]